MSSVTDLGAVPRYARLSEEEFSRRLATATREVLPYYPELASLDFEVRLSRSRRVAGYFRRPARARERPLIYIARDVARREAGEFCKVLAHEMGHLLQYAEPEWPDGEKACDLIWLARCGARFPSPPVYLSIGKIRNRWSVHAAAGERLAREAWAQRKTGLRTYISWWEKEMRRSAYEGAGTVSGSSGSVV